MVRKSHNFGPVNWGFLEGFGSVPVKCIKHEARVSLCFVLFRRSGSLD